MKKYLLIETEEFFRKLKVESAKIGKSMKTFIVEAVEEKIKRRHKKEPNEEGEDI